MLVKFNTLTACTYFQDIYTHVCHIAQLILLSGAGDGDDNKGKKRLIVRL